MKFNNKFFPILIAAGAFGMFSSCNKDVDAPVPLVNEPSGQSIADIVNADASLTFLKAAVARASTNTTFGTSLLTLLADRNSAYTLFAPTDAGFQLSGIPSIAAIGTLRPGFLDTVLRYHVVGGTAVSSDLLPGAFTASTPNVQLPTMLVLAPPSAAVPPGLRMSIFPSKRGTNLWANNIPITEGNIRAANGIIHKTATLVSPPSALLWNRIDVDPNLTYLRAAILRADSGSAAGSSLQTALLTPPANLTVFAPNNLAFQTILTGLITQALVAQGVPPATAAVQAAALASSPTVFSNPALYSSLTAMTVRGLIAYHVLFGSRDFSVNIPTTATAVPTLLNSSIAIHPGVTIQATFGPTGVTAATVKGLVNPTASNFIINPLPGGTSDQHYINGVLHVIDQVLRPQ